MEMQFKRESFLNANEGVEKKYNQLSAVCGLKLEPLINLRDGSIVGYEVLSVLTDGTSAEKWFALQKPSHLMSLLKLQLACIKKLSLPDELKLLFNISIESLLGMNIKDLNYFSQFKGVSFEISNASNIKRLTNEVRVVLFRRIDELRKLNFEVWFDDFYIDDLIILNVIMGHIDGVKIDRRELHKPWLKEEIRILRKTLTNIPVIIEGIESEEDLSLVSNQDVLFAQGYLWKEKIIKCTRFQHE